MASSQEGELQNGQGQVFSSKKLGLSDGAETDGRPINSVIDTLRPVGTPTSTGRSLYYLLTKHFGQGSGLRLTLGRDRLLGIVGWTCRRRLFYGFRSLARDWPEPIPELC